MAAASISIRRQAAGARPIDGNSALPGENRFLVTEVPPEFVLVDRTKPAIGLPASFPALKSPPSLEDAQARRQIRQSPVMKSLWFSRHGCRGGTTQIKGSRSPRPPSLEPALSRATLKRL